MAGENKIPSEVYLNELKYMNAVARHVQDFDRFLNSVPQNEIDIRRAVQDCYYAEPDQLLSREKLQRLRESNPPVWKQVSSFYREFLDKELGFK